jgi:hypothetical protein
LEEKIKLLVPPASFTSLAGGAVNMYITPQGNRNCPSVQTMVMKRNNGITETVVSSKR